MIPAIVTQIAAETAQTSRGVVIATYERAFRVHAGPASRSDHLVFTGVYQNGTLVAVHVTDDTLGGVAATAAQRAQTESQYAHPQPADLFRPPWDARFLGDYVYRVIDPVTIGFTSTVTDTAHGSGTFTIDAQRNVVAYQYVMSGNPQYVTSATISGERAQVLAGYWATTHEIQQYVGRYHAVAGGATTEITQSGFVRYPSVTAAQATFGSP